MIVLRRELIENDKRLPQINGARKRMISIHYILKQILMLMNLDSKKISISQSKRTLAFYDQLEKYDGFD